MPDLTSWWNGLNEVQQVGASWLLAIFIGMAVMAFDCIFGDWLRRRRR